ncbi:MAG: O-antigen ligase family protein [Flavobacteriales bacterium]|nr:O-antigen ligase family protein [Flavobacteriales bacterium]
MSGIILAVMVFMMPVFVRIVPLLAGLYLLNTLLSPAPRWHFPPRNIRPAWYLIMAFYLLHVVGLLYTEHLSLGTFDLQVKLPLLAFPLIIGLVVPPEPKVMFRIRRAFVFGCVAASLMCLGRAAWIYLVDGAFAFTYTALSFHMHVGYFAMYLLMALCFVYVEILEGKGYSSTRWLIVVFFLILMEVLLQSKMALLLTAMLLLTAVIASWLKKDRQRLSTGLALGAVLLYMLITQFIVTPDVSRVYMASKNLDLARTETDTKESSMIRLIIWRIAGNIMAEHPVIGVGTGDVMPELKSYYKDMNLMSAYDQQLNAHNQFFQTTIALGVMGLLVLIALLVCSLVLAWRSHAWRSLLFLIVTGGHFLTESVLETQAGTLFFGLFFSLLVLTEPRIREAITVKNQQVNDR